MRWWVWLSPLCSLVAYLPVAWSAVRRRRLIRWWPWCLFWCSAALAADLVAPARWWWIVLDIAVVAGWTAVGFYATRWEEFYRDG